MNLSRTRRRSLVPVLVAGVGAVALLAGCAAEAPASEEGGASEPIGTEFIAGTFDQAAADLLPADIAEAGVIVSSGGPGYAPHFLLAEDGETLVGNDIELLAAIGDVLGVEIDYEALGFDAIIPSLQSERIDMANGAMSITEQRLEAVDFVSYFAGGTSIIVPAGNPLDLDLDSLCGRRLAVQQGTVYADNYVPEFQAGCEEAGEEPIEVSVFPTQPDATLALSSGRADASMSDFGPLSYIAETSNGALETVEALYDPSTWGFAFPQGSELEPAIQAAVNALIADGTYAEILAKWDVSAGAIEESEIVTS